MAGQQVGEVIEFSQSMVKGLTRWTNNLSGLKPYLRKKLLTSCSFGTVMTHLLLSNKNRFSKMGILPSVNFAYSFAQGKKLVTSLNPYSKNIQYQMPRTRFGSFFKFWVLCYF